MPEIDVKALLASMRQQLEKDQAEGRLAGLTVEDLMDAVSHPKAAAVIGETLALEGGSVKPGEPAPDFTLPRLSGSGSVTLSDHFGKRPVALVFGSYT